MNPVFSNAAPATRILWLNPVGFDAYDAPIAELLGQIKRPETSLELVSFDMPRHTTHLEYRTYESLVVADIVRMARYADEEGFDSVVIGCFYDPALEEAREISGNTIITAPCQASIQIMSNLCNRFSIIVGRDKWKQKIRERVRHYGADENLASIRSMDLGVDEFQRDTARTEQRILDVARQAVAEDHAEGLILGCTIEYGFFQEVQKVAGVPVIDAVFASFKMAEYLGAIKTQFGWQPSRAWGCAPPPEAELEKFGIFKDAPPIGNRIQVAGE